METLRCERCSKVLLETHSIEAALGLYLSKPAETEWLEDAAADVCYCRGCGDPIVALALKKKQERDPLEISNGKGMTMLISRFMHKMARAYGWNGEVADESLALAMEAIRSDKENSIGARQGIGGSEESHAVMEFCRGRAFNPVLCDPGPPADPDDHVPF
jgi:hypothetical protein